MISDHLSLRGLQVIIKLSKDIIGIQPSGLMSRKELLFSRYFENYCEQLENIIHVIVSKPVVLGISCPLGSYSFALKTPCSNFVAGFGNEPGLRVDVATGQCI
jgi:hypothetical protein